MSSSLGLDIESVVWADSTECFTGVGMGARAREIGRDDITVHDYVKAAAVPVSIPTGKYGPWFVSRNFLPPTTHRNDLGRSWYTLLMRGMKPTMYNIHLGDSPMDIVMDDSHVELYRHAPIWMAASGRVLITGLGMGCVVRGLLLNPDVTHIDILEIDSDIIGLFGAEFSNNPRVQIWHADALTWKGRGGEVWDYAWHDIWTDEPNRLPVLHGKLVLRYRKRVLAAQGMWGMPSWMKRHMALQGIPLIGAPKV